MNEPPNRGRQRPPQRPAPPPVRRHGGTASFWKLVLVAFLIGFALCLQVTVWTLEVLLEERHTELAIQNKKSQKRKTAVQPDKPASAAGGTTHNGDKLVTSFTTVKSSETTSAATLHTGRSSVADTGSSALTQGEAYWHVAVHQWLSSWDPNDAQRYMVPLDNQTLPAGYYLSKRATRDISDTGYNFPTTFVYTPVGQRATTGNINNDGDDDSDMDTGHSNSHHTSSSTAAANLIHALTQAARQGHAAAQFHLANALSAGFWPMDGAINPYTVQETWTVPTSKQQQEAFLYWRMAAMQGHVEAAMALAHRMETSVGTKGNHNNNNNLNKVMDGRKRSTDSSCWKTVPVWEAAAAGIIDQLEADTNSRGKVAPATDKHELYLIHLHGGTNSQLDHNNRAYESADALQFYHLRAVNMRGTEASAQAAYTLAQYYHHGIRGVTQNLTLAAEYYTMAAEYNHWEAAGQLGKFYMWGIGVPQDPYMAQRFFAMGVPAGLYDCQSRYSQLAKQQAKKKDSGTVLCEANCLNGMGLINLFGLPHVMPINVAEAEAYFELARDQGSGEAAYNLAMLRLGWKLHWKPYEQISSNGQTTLQDQVFNKDSPINYPSQSEYQSILSDLRIAASKGNIMANFRLGLLYAEGVSIPKGGSGTHTHITVVPKDCEKATKHFKWVVDNASPDRARRMKTAYQQYMAGDTANALRNYLAAAATGSETAQLNAAFLLERGTCPGLATSVDCAKAAVRLWKAAAERGQGEACLRVGDFYYYGRLRPTRQPVGPFGWTRYLVFPEEFLAIAVPRVRKWVEEFFLSSSEETAAPETEDAEPTCNADGAEETCSADEGRQFEFSNDEEHSLEGDLEIAAHYYQLAATSKENARANFNLGFLYEWGMGLKQDFPLAKRHYDLAKSSHSRDSDLPVVIALFTLSLHERLVKLWMAFEDWLSSRGYLNDNEPDIARRVPRQSPSVVGIPRPSKRDKMDVILAHIFSWDSLLILILTVLFFLLVRCGATR